jgi:hypothetical protein
MIADSRLATASAKVCSSGVNAGVAFCTGQHAHGGS